jgi:hypothetical protein
MKNEGDDDDDDDDDEEEEEEEDRDSLFNIWSSIAKQHKFRNNASCGLQIAKSLFE